MGNAVLLRVPVREHSASSFNVDVLKLQVILLDSLHLTLRGGKHLSYSHTENTVPRLTSKALSPLSNLFIWAEKEVIVMVAHGNSIPFIKPCSHKSGPRGGGVLFLWNT